MESVKLIVFVLLFSLSLPIFGYAFTSLAQTAVIPEIALDREDLIAAGLTVNEGQSETIVFAPAVNWTYFDIGNSTYRLSWYDPALQAGIFHLQRQANWADKFFNTWFFPETQGWLNPDTNIPFNAFASGINNDTVIAEFDENRGWSWFITKNGLNIFFSYNATEATSINEAIDTDGSVIVTLATGKAWSNVMDFEGVIDWYFRLLVGDDAFGMPTELSWLIRIISAVMVVAAIWLAKDLIRL